MFRLSKKAKIGICALLTASIICPFTYAYRTASSLNGHDFTHIEVPTANTNYDEIIKKAEETKSEYEKKASETKDKIDSLQVEYDSILSYIKELDQKQNDLTAEIIDIESAMNNLVKDKQETEAKLEAATEKKDKQYETMKSRIKYLYENGETSYLDIIFSTNNITDLLNRVEYVAQISKYDDQLFANYSAAVKEVTEYNDMLDIQIDAIEDVQKTYDSYYEYAEALIAAKNQALEECAAKKGIAVDLYKEYINEIEEQNMNIEQAQASKKAEEEAAKKAAEEAAKKAAEEAAKRAAAGKSTTPKSTGNTNASNVTLSDNADLYSMIWPAPGYSRITSPFGPRRRPTAGASTNHRGTDIGAPYGAAVVAAAAGKVIRAGWGNSEGNYIIIDHGGFQTVYMHASRLAVTEGTYVKQGQVIMYVGATGAATGPHLHFGLKINGGYVDAMNYVKY